MNVNILNYAEKGVLSDIEGLTQRVPTFKGSVTGNNPTVLDRYINNLEKDYEQHIRRLRIKNASYEAIHHERELMR